MGTGIGRGVLEIVSMILGIALVTLILNRSGDAKGLISTSANSLDMLVRTITLQNGGVNTGGSLNGGLYG